MKNALRIALFAALAAATSFASAGPVQMEQIEAYHSNATVSGNYEDASSFGGRARFKIGDLGKITASFASVDAFGDQGTIIGLGGSVNINKNLYATLDASTSTPNNTILPDSRFSYMLNYRVGDSRRVVVGIGGDHFKMDTGATYNAVGLQTLVYLHEAATVLQFDGNVSESNPGKHPGYKFGAAATFGRPGTATVTLRADHGRANYQYLAPPAVIANPDFTSTHAAITSYIWIDKFFGFFGAYDIVRNEFYDRNEVRVGLFAGFGSFEQ